MTDSSLHPLPPSFVACCGRSGSTLLRWLIDAHPEIGCPGETDVAVFLNGYVRVATDLMGRSADQSAAQQQGRRAVEELFAPYLAASGKSRWCDKSLSNVFHLDLLATCWPEARFVLLYRHCMDFVMNGIEVSPWGLVDYGFAQVAQKSPTDSVVALAAYWIDRTARMLAFEQQFPGRCLRLRYEDLVTRTDESLERLWGFIGVEALPDIARRAFEVEHSTFGAADHEIWYTNGIHSDSIGEGARVPPDHVVGPLRSNVNELLGRLDYVLVDDRWGAGFGWPHELSPADALADASSALAELRVLEGHEVLWRSTVDLAVGSFGDWALPGELGPDEAAPTPFVVAVDRGALAGFSSGNLNIGTALRDRSVRHYGPLLSYFHDEREIFERVATLLAAKSGELLDHLERARSRPS